MGKRYEQNPQKKRYTDGSKYMKRCLISFVMRELQIKTRHDHNPIRIAKIQNTDNGNCWLGYGAKGISIHC